jgi:hypothetical protein
VKERKNNIVYVLIRQTQPQALVARTYHPLFSNFLFTNLFSIKKNYFFIISSLFPYFNLFVSIFIQSYVNIKLHVSTLYSKCNLMLTKDLSIYIGSTVHMQFGVNIRLYEYWHEQVKIRKKRWNYIEIKKFYWK